MKKYKIVGDHVVYGGPQNYQIRTQAQEKSFYALQPRSSLYASDLTLLEAIDWIKQKNIDERDEIGIDAVMSELSTPKNMGCYNRYEIIEDRSIDTIWKYLSKIEKMELFDYANAYMDNECGDVPLLRKKTEFDETT